MLNGGKELRALHRVVQCRQNGKFLVKVLATTSLLKQRGNNDGFGMKCRDLSRGKQRELGLRLQLTRAVRGQRLSHRFTNSPIRPGKIRSRHESLHATLVADRL